VIRITCPDADNGLADGTSLPRERRQPSLGAPLFEGNPLAGPIFVEGLTLHDTLVVTLNSIELTRNYGITLIAPAHGMLSRDELFGPKAATIEEAVPRHMYRWRLDTNRCVAELENPLGTESISTPLRPMLGSIGVCPSWGQSLSSLLAGVYGGNLDLPLIKPGATLFLPVYEPGGMLLLGDVHAAQGAGEIVGGGIETSGVVTITVRHQAKRTIPAPRLIVDGNIFAIATEGDLRIAVNSAYSRLLDCLTSDLHVNRWDAYQLLSHAGIVELGGLSIASNLTVAAGLPIEQLPARCQEELLKWL
jgi:acetamidase/formamidase